MLSTSIAEAFRSVLSEKRDLDEALLYVLKNLGYADFDTMNIEYVVEGYLVTESPLHIGAGDRAEPYSPVDKSFVRTRVRGKHLPFIPGSSIRGVLRSYAEAVATSMDFMKPYIVINQVGEIKCTADGLADSYETLRRSIDKLVSLDVATLSQLLDKCLCSPVVGLFGAPWLGSHIHVYDAYPDGDVTTSVLQRVAIDRFTASQRPGLLYSVEVVEPGTRWRFRMRILNIDLRNDSDPRTRILKELLRAMRRGIHIGSRTSTGQGLVKLIDASYYVVRVDPQKGVVEEGPYPLQSML